MSTAAVTVEKLVKLEPRNLEFEKSASRAVALEGGMMAKMAQYGPRIASFLRIGGAGSFMVAGVKGFTKAEEALEAAAAIPGPLASGLAASAATSSMIASGLFAAAGLLMLAAGIVMIVYGNKKKQQERAAKAGDVPEPVGGDPITRIFRDVYKMAMPAKYPIEAGSGYGMLASVCVGIGGAVIGNPLYIAIGVIATIATAIALFGHEQKKAQAATTQGGLQFGQSKSQSVGAEGPKHSLIKNPIRLSSILLILNGGVALAAGAQSADPFVMATGICSMIGNAIMAIFVHKNDYNVNAAKQAQVGTQPMAQVKNVSASKLRPAADMQVGFA